MPRCVAAEQGCVCTVCQCPFYETSGIHGLRYLQVSNKQPCKPLMDEKVLCKLHVVVNTLSREITPDIFNPLLIGGWGVLLKEKKDGRSVEIGVSES